MTNTNNPAAGWYPDPQNPMQQRLWDGATWTDQTRPSLPGQVPGHAANAQTFRGAIKEGLSNFANFKGRSSRRAYWFFVLFSFLANFAETLILGTGILGLVLFLPQIAAAVRRMHDIDRSGWFILVPFANIYWACQPGAATPNRYGAAPR